MSYFFSVLFHSPQAVSYQILTGAIYQRARNFDKEKRSVRNYCIQKYLWRARQEAKNKFNQGDYNIQ